METWKIITNVILTVIILVLTIVVIVDYIKHKDDDSISARSIRQSIALYNKRATDYETFCICHCIRCNIVFLFIV